MFSGCHVFGKSTKMASSANDQYRNEIRTSVLLYKTTLIVVKFL